MEWELSKENYQPLKQGRDPSKLNVKLQLQCKNSEVEEQRRAFWTEIAEYKGDDPLEVWLRFIKWTQETFKAGGHQAELVPLLERCTRELQGSDNYKSDVRYLRLWIQYADCLPEPRDVFAFLKENDIGQDFALYYIAYATYLELRGNFAKADAVFQAGVDRLAHPVDRLRSKFVDFQHRMAKRVQRKAQESAEAGLGLEAEPGPNRQAFSVIQSSASRSRRAQPTLRQPTPATAPAPAAPRFSLSWRPKRKALLTPGKSENASGGLEIFVDDEFQPGGGGSPAPITFARETSAPAGSAWTKLGSMEATRKENVQQASAWAGQKLAQKKALVPALAPALDIPVDEELVDQATPTKESSAPEGTLRQRLDRVVQPSNLDEDLLKNPLHLHKDPRLAQSMAAEQSAAPAAHAPSSSHASKRKKSETQAYANVHLGNDSPAEISFEEVRAERWLKQNRLPMDPIPPFAPETAADAIESGDEPEAMVLSPLPAVRSGAPASAPACPAGDSASQHAQQAERLVTLAEARLPPINVAVEGLRPDSPEQPTTAGKRAADSALAALQAQQAFGAAPALQVNTARAHDDNDVDDQPATAGGRAAESALAALQAHELLGNAPMLSVQAPKPEAGAEPSTAGKRLVDGVEPAARQPFAEAQQHRSMPAANAENAPPHARQRPPRHDAENRQPQAVTDFGANSPAMKALRAHQPFAKRAALQVRTGLLSAAPLQAAAPAGGSLCTASEAAALSSAAEPDANVTMATQDAFDTINSMFSGSLPHNEQAHVPKPTVTISTQAAFAELNNMFSADLPHQQCRAKPIGSFNPTSRAGPNATVTMSTKEAFAALNGMFSADLPHQRRATKGSFLMAEPTVTLSTQAAFDAMNDMFSADLPHQRARLPRLPLPKSRFAPQPPQAAAPAPPLQSPGPGIYEDTALLSKDDASTAERSELAVYEDTALLDKENAGACSASNELGMYEDTALLGGDSAAGHAMPDPSMQATPQRAGSAAASDVFAIYEDTQFVSQPFGQPPAGPMDDEPAELGVYEDTQFVTRSGGAQRPGSESGDEQDALPVYEDTQFITRPVAMPAASSADDEILGVYEDTQFLEQPTAAPAAASRSRSAAALHALQPLPAQRAPSTDNCSSSDCAAPDSDQENDAALDQSMRRLPARSIHAADAQAAALRPLDELRAEALRVQLSSGLTLHDVENGTRPPEEVLAQAGSPDQDDFEVYEDPAASSAAAAAGPLVDPFDPALQARLLQDLEPALEQWDDVSTCSASQASKAGELLRRTKRSLGSKPTVLQLGQCCFQLHDCIGQGAFATVFDAMEIDGSGNTTSSPVALKLQAPACAWEFYICKALRGRATPALRSCFVDARRLFLAPDLSVLETPAGQQGTLQDLVNIHLKAGQRMEEVVVMYYTMELLRLVAELHHCHILHTDLKPDNLLLRNEGANQALADWQPNRPGAWALRGLTLIDFGRSVDLALLPEGSQFLGDSMTDAFRCIEMQEKRPWTYGVDSYGICAIVHCMLFGEYMHVVKAIDSAGEVQYRLRSAFKRYWATDLWDSLFTSLLHHSDTSSPPPCLQLLARFEAHLAAQPGLARKLRAELLKQDALVKEQRTF